MNHGHFTPPRTPMRGVTASAVFVAMRTEFLRDKGVKPQKAELNDWEDEGGSLAVPVTAPLSSNAPGNVGNAPANAYVGNVVKKSELLPEPAHADGNSVLCAP